ncbi:MAG TPA: AraC family transcriptional regulator [Planctomycetota bacterium]|nr:AraC family transcriptional regulator [Planctomycetota bacterium]
MDNTTGGRKPVYRDLRRMARHYPTGLPVRALGYVPAKTDRVRRRYERLSFSFILTGRGEHIVGGRKRPVEGPCVLVNRPGVEQEFGPEGAWEEFYVNFAAEHAAAAEARGLFAPDRPVWPVHGAGALRRGVLDVIEALGDIDSYGRVDLIDRMCESLVVGSLISAASPPLDGRDRAVQAVRAHIEGHYMEPLDPDELALERGLSPSDFRRRWAAMVRVPPGQFIARLRIREACRLLVQTSHDVGEVARMVGFSDPLYFARRFKRTVGETASDYRRRNR